MFAIDDLSDAIDVTRAFLTPVRLGTWLKLAVIVFFLGGIGFGNPAFSGGFGGDPAPGPGTGPEPGPGAIDVGEWLPVLVVAGLILLVVWLAFALVGSLLEFTFLESLRSDDVRLRRYTRRNVGRGLSLFGFRLALSLVLLLVLGAPLTAIVFATAGDVSMVLLGLYALVAIPVYLVYAVINRFTTVFVAPTMLQEEVGALDAWRRFWETLTANWTEYLAYLLLVWLLQLVVSFAIGILMFVLAIPFLLVFVLFLFIPFLNLIVLLLGIPLFVVLALLVQVPVVAYLRYYALLLLGDTDAALDLIPEQRGAVRGGGGDSGGSGGSAGGPAQPDGRDDGRDTHADRDRTEDDEYDLWGNSNDTDPGDSDDPGDRDDENDRGGW
ncbi:DUF7544 domain-containing protein [Natrinema salifodinae]|uniref:Membrane domain of glycerophosphoryl diester phosphodiesterase n=1 Tax=Natrinema salifodinae TaxID=1202768 RepID=A0A1I0NFQ5_9EURY|nr:hypothetical protein [Natrinema salifodinae]SEW00190.1 hypothetical protein SAMN05216285_1683 [Natrinema salifodinae]